MFGLQGLAPLAQVWHAANRVISLVTDPNHEGTDYIMEHPEMQKMCEGVIDLGNGMTVHFG